jgi:hypothetical protein
MKFTTAKAKSEKQHFCHICHFSAVENNSMTNCLSDSLIFVTVTKTQEQALQWVGICLPSPIFSSGQLCVAFSRASSFDDVFVGTAE